MSTAIDPDLLARLTPPADDHVSTEHDDHLADAIRATTRMRRAFYAAVLIVALYGTATGAAATFDLPWWIGFSGVLALELGGITFLSHADVRRRVGEHAAGPRLLGGCIAAAAATFNLITHHDRLLGGFFALMSVLGFVSWWIDVESKRRDRLRARGMAPAPPPRYALWSHWLRHPMITAHARALATQYPQLGREGSLQAADLTRRQQRRNALLATALRNRMRDSAGADLAQLATLTYDMNEVARRLQSAADYDGLTALIGADLKAPSLLPTPATENRRQQQPSAVPTPRRRVERRQTFAARAMERSDKTMTTATSPLQQRRSDHPGHPIPRALRDHANESTVTLTARRVPSAREPQSPKAVRVTVVGEPAILGRDGAPVRGVRAKGMEVLTFLAVHRDGATTSDIIGAIWPDTPADRAVQRLSTCLSNVRGAIREVAGAGAMDQTAKPIEPIVNLGGRYCLDPDVVTVDCWGEHEDNNALPTTPPQAIASACNYAWLTA